MEKDELLREDRLIFYREDMDRINSVLREFLSLSGARCVLLVDKDGHLITQSGELRNCDSDTVSALVAGSFAATREMARLLGEEEFSVLSHQGRSGNIQLSLVDDRSLAAVVFDESTTLGLVRLYGADMVNKLTATFADAAVRQRGRRETLTVGFGEDASRNLDGVFGT